MQVCQGDLVIGCSRVVSIKFPGLFWKSLIVQFFFERLVVTYSSSGVQNRKSDSLHFVF